MLAGLRRFKEDLPDYQNASAVGKLSPEAARFTAVKVREIGQALAVWLKELEAL